MHIKGQDTGKVNFSEEGIGFTIPENWMGQELKEAYLMASTKDAGMIVLLFHPAKTLDELEAKLQEGLNEDDVKLSLISELKQSSTNALEGLYEGSVNGQAVKGHLFGIVNPFGNGVAVLSLVAPELYSVFTRNIAVEVVNSLKFSKPSKSPLSNAAAEYKKELSNTKLVYISTGFSADTSLDGSDLSSGYDKQIEINLCASGYFTYYYRSVVSTTSSDVYAGGADEARGDGKWQIENDGEEVVLLLETTEGDSYEFVLTYENEELFLNGERYLRDYAQCD